MISVTYIKHSNTDHKHEMTVMTMTMELIFWRYFRCRLTTEWRPSKLDCYESLGNSLATERTSRCQCFQCLKIRISVVVALVALIFPKVVARELPPKKALMPPQKNTREALSKWRQICVLCTKFLSIIFRAKPNVQFSAQMGVLDSERKTTLKKKNETKTLTWNVKGIL